MNTFEIRKITANDRNDIASFIKDEWGSEIIVSRGRIHNVNQLPGFMVKAGKKIIGLVTYSLENDCEIVTLDSVETGKGLGTQLIEKVKEVAKKEDKKRLWLITTNDNTNALIFYQKKGFTIAAIHINEISNSRKLKPEIPLVGFNSIPIRDEIELEMQLS
jgi:N-acetylglutamate synthase-like GNAT family acetyltransferase